MSTEPIDAITTEATDLPELFEDVLVRLLGITDEAPVEDVFMVGFAARGADATALLRAIADQVLALMAEHEARAVDCRVSGVMAIDEGHRAWGFLTLAPADGDARPQTSVVVDDVTVDELARGRWRASLTIRRAGA